MITATVTETRQTGMEEWTDFRHSKDFKMDSTLQDVEDWAKTFEISNDFFHVKFSKKEE